MFTLLSSPGQADQRVHRDAQHPHPEGVGAARARARRRRRPQQERARGQRVRPETIEPLHTSGVIMSNNRGLPEVTEEKCLKL